MSSANLSLNTTAVLDTGTMNFTPPGLNFPSTPGIVTKVTVPAGSATLTPPPLTNAILVIVPPTAASVGIKNAAGDSVIPIVLSPTNSTWFILPMGTPIIVTSTAQIPGVEVRYF